MPDLQEAFELFHLQDGTTFDVAKKAYRKFAKASHPDLQMTTEGKFMAEIHLKKVNVLFDLLEQHFKSQHDSQQECFCLSIRENQRQDTNTDRSTNREREFGEIVRDSAEKLREMANKPKFEERVRQAAEHLQNSANKRFSSSYVSDPDKFYSYRTEKGSTFEQSVVRRAVVQNLNGGESPKKQTPSRSDVLRRPGAAEKQFGEELRQLYLDNIKRAQQKRTNHASSSFGAGR